MSNNAARRDFGAVAVSAVLVAFGIVALIDTTTYSDADSAVFPRTVASAMIVFALLAAVRTLLRLEAAVDKPEGSALRRIALPILMIAGAAAMPWIGFLTSMILMFLAILIAAMHDRWTGFRLAVYPVAGIIIVIGFYALFRYAFLVPLPDGRLF